jgi:lipopolysaccharide biosynthesis glycosyltransferase
MTSVAQHAKRPIELFVLHDDSVGAAPKQRLMEIAQALRTPLTLMPVRPPPTLPARFFRQYSPACVFRLMIPKLFPDAEAVVYLDSDLVSNGVDVTEIAEAAPKDAAISGVIERYIAAIPRHREVLAEMGLDPAGYINSGVLVIRPALIEEDLVAECLAFSQAQPNAVHADQDFLNHHFAGRIGALPERFNTHVGLFDEGLIQPLSAFQGRILHYSGMVKPLDGPVSTGLIPFLAHAYLTPEVLYGQKYEITGYFQGTTDDPNALLLQPIRQKAEG